MGVQDNGSGDMGLSSIPLGAKNKYKRMDSELNHYSDDDLEVVPYKQTQQERSSSTRKYVFACAVFASLNNVLLGYVEGFLKFAEGEGVEERAKEFLKLDPIVRTFKPRIPDPIEEEEGENQEISATQSTTMSSTQRSGSKSVGKSASKFAMEDLDSMISSKGEKKNVLKTHVPMVRQVSTRAKSAAPKRKKLSSSDEGWFNKEKQVHDLLSEVMESIRDDHDYAVKELQQTTMELRATLAANDKAMTKMKKDYEKQLAVTKTQADEAMLVATEEAKNSALKSILQARIKVVEEALDPAFDKSSWDVTKWKNALADLMDDDEEPMPEKMDVSGAAGADLEIGSVEGGDKPVGDEGRNEKA